MEPMSFRLYVAPGILFLLLSPPVSAQNARLRDFVGSFERISCSQRIHSSPETLDIEALDRDGLMVEGIPFHLGLSEKDVPVAGAISQHLCTPLCYIAAS